MEQVLPPAAEVHYWHDRLLAFANSGKPLPVRYASGKVRGDVCRTITGAAFRPTDNSPAWWMHFVAFNSMRDARLDEVPCHMFEAMRLMPRNISTAGWHVAHIISAKDRNTDWQEWTAADVARRFLRNMHPCNCFYLPKRQWQQYGGHHAVIGYVAKRYAERYGPTWVAFLDRTAGATIPTADGSMRYLLSPETPRALRSVPGTAAVAASYSYSRLCFRADVIEPLQDNDVFEVITPKGRFRMTKAEFHRSFHNVIASKSYRENRIYHYSLVPAKALLFRVAE